MGWLFALFFAVSALFGVDHVTTTTSAATPIDHTYCFMYKDNRVLEQNPERYCIKAGERVAIYNVVTHETLYVQPSLYEGGSTILITQDGVLE